jgi:hypothetical protein
VVVAAGRDDSGNETRDKRTSQDIAPSGDSTIQVTGVFTLHGMPHELTVPAQIHIDGTNCIVQTHFAVPLKGPVLPLN